MSDRSNVDYHKERIDKTVKELLDLDAEMQAAMERHIKPIREKVTAAKRNLTTDTEIPFADVKPFFDLAKRERKTREFMDDDDGAKARDNMRLAYEALKPGEILSMDAAWGSDDADDVPDDSDPAQIYLDWRAAQMTPDETIEGALYFLRDEAGDFHAFNIAATTAAEIIGASSDDYHTALQTEDGPMPWLKIPGARFEAERTEILAGGHRVAVDSGNPHEPDVAVYAPSDAAAEQAAA